MRPKLLREDALSDTSPTPGTSGAEPSDIGRLLRALWHYRAPLLVAGLVCALAGGAGAMLRQPHWIGAVNLAIGHIPPVRVLQDASELAQQLASERQLLELADLGHCIRVDRDAPRPPDCPRFLDVETEAIEDTTLVTLTVETNSSEVATRIVEGVTQRILQQHQALFDEVRENNERNLKEFEALLARLNAELARRGASGAGGAGAGEVELGDTWSQVVAARQHIETLRGYSLAAHARPTRAIAGPEVAQLDRKPGPMAAGILGAFAGLALAGLAIAMRQAVAGQG